MHNHLLANLFARAFQIPNPTWVIKISGQLKFFKIYAKILSQSIINFIQVKNEGAH